jgi:hypothetical protein
MDHIGVDVHARTARSRRARRRCRWRSMRRSPPRRVPPDVMLMRGNARQLVLLAEAAQAARAVSWQQ